MFELRLFIYDHFIRENNWGTKSSGLVRVIISEEAKFYHVEFYCTLLAFSDWDRRQFKTDSLSCFYAIDGKG